MKKLVILSVLSVIFFAQTAFGQVNCNTVDVLGNAAASFITDQINDEIGGTTTRINSRKSLKIHYAHNLSFDGCKLKMKLRVKLKRKVRRDAVGNIRMSARVSSFSRTRVCVRNAKVEGVNLSHTTSLGEAVYRMVANQSLPNNTCYDL